MLIWSLRPGLTTCLGHSLHDNSSKNIGLIRATSSQITAITQTTLNNGAKSPQQSPECRKPSKIPVDKIEHGLEKDPLPHLHGWRQVGKRESGTGNLGFHALRSSAGALLSPILTGRKGVIVVVNLPYSQLWL